MKVQRAKGYIIERGGGHAEVEAHKVKACTMTRQGPMHRWRSKARPHAPMEVQSAMGHAKAKAVKSERAMKAKRGTSKRWGCEGTT